jgi:hypothetical protein
MINPGPSRSIGRTGAHPQASVSHDSRHPVERAGASRCFATLRSCAGCRSRGCEGESGWPACARATGCSLACVALALGSRPRDSRRGTRRAPRRVRGWKRSPSKEVIIACRSWGPPRECSWLFLGSRAGGEDIRFRALQGANLGGGVGKERVASAWRLRCGGLRATPFAESKIAPGAQ